MRWRLFRIVLGQNVNECVRIFFMGFAVFVIPGKDGIRIGGYVGHKTEQISFSNIYGSDFSCPGKQILKDVFVDTAKVCKIEVSFDRMLLQVH